MSDVAVWRNGEKDDDADDEMIYFAIDMGDRHFNDNIFGFSRPVPINYKTGLRDTLHNLESLERFIDGHEEVSYGGRSQCNLDVSLEEALYYPRRISDRIPILQEYPNQITTNNIKFMWCRLVAHYFEYLYGVPEIKQLPDPDKVKLVLHHLCRIICFAVGYRTYKANMRQGMLLGGGIIFMPSNDTDDKLGEYMNDLERAIQQLIIQEFYNLKITEEEYIFTKLICLFSNTDVLELSFLGSDLCPKARSRYLSMLKECIQARTDYNSHDKVIRRMQAILNILPQLDLVNEIDEHHLSILVQRGTVSLRGQLPTEIHVLSRKTSHQLL